jgi:hypothetical protein
MLMAPFGFTWEDVDLVEACMSAVPYGDDGQPDHGLQHLRDRIAALLPPRTP